eukprot:c43347_g1_i1 orf=562-1173(+)
MSSTTFAARFLPANVHFFLLYQHVARTHTPTLSSLYFFVYQRTHILSLMLSTKVAAAAAWGALMMLVQTALHKTLRAYSLCILLLIDCSCLPIHVLPLFCVRSERESARAPIRSPLVVAPQQSACFLCIGMAILHHNESHVSSIYAAAGDGVVVALCEKVEEEEIRNNLLSLSPYFFTAISLFLYFPFHSSLCPSLAQYTGKE